MVKVPSGVMPASPPAADPRALLDLATGVAERAADLLLDGARQARTSVATKSSLTDMVTEMDRASEDLIVRELLAARPDDSILAEEGGTREGTSPVRWVIDPLDGTTNYLYGHPGWAVSIAAEVTTGPTTGPTTGATTGPTTEVVAGVVLDVVHGDVYTAALGHGARCSGQPIHCSDQDEVARSLVATGFAYAPERRRLQAEALVDLLPRIRDIRRMGAASVDLCMVGRGRVDAYFEWGLSWWDWAAGLLVAREAGATVLPLSGPPRAPGSYADSVLAAAPAIAAPLSALLRSVGAVPVG
jgi:myo-inositol-1(or 4)-monophosphatase